MNGLYSSTDIPLSQECKCRRLWFFYHDVRAFTTSWLPQPLFLIWRVFIACYLLAWMIADIVERSDNTGTKWLLLYSNLAYLLLVVVYTMLAVITFMYTVEKYCYKKVMCLSAIPGEYDTPPDVYSHDYISFFEKISWFLWTVAISSAPSAVVGFFAADLLNGYHDNTHSAETIHLHGINLAIIFADTMLSRMPLQILHFPWAGLFNVLYVIFTAIYYATRSTGHGLDGSGNGDGSGDNYMYIYEALDYQNSPVESAGWAILLGLSAFIIHFVWWSLVIVRDSVYKIVNCCNRDIIMPERII